MRTVSVLALVAAMVVCGGCAISLSLSFGGGSSKEVKETTIVCGTSGCRDITVTRSGGGAVSVSTAGDGIVRITCGPRTVEIRDVELWVDGKNYGRLDSGDKVDISDDKVRVNGCPRTPDP